MKRLHEGARGRLHEGAKGRSHTRPHNRTTTRGHDTSAALSATLHEGDDTRARGGDWATLCLVLKINRMESGRVNVHILNIHPVTDNQNY
jgi:hypothetical protein